LQAQHDKDTNMVVWLKGEVAKNENNKSELLMLRGQVGSLQNKAQNAAKLAADNKNLEMKLAWLEGQWKFTTNAPHFQNPYLDKSEWSSFSHSTKEPFDTFQSMLAALGAHDENLLAQLVARKDVTQSPY